MEREVLKEQLKDAISGRKVKAALFYTFNFDPSFFENYVMPLLVPSKTFQNETIYNNILWRRCAKEGVIPPVTVYCDHYAKDNAMAPTLGYEIRCVRLGGNPGALVNFHPKECWLLMDNDEIIQVNASANLTPSGWCENLECCSIIYPPKNSHPKTVTINSRQRMMKTICALAIKKRFSPAEDLIYNALRYTDDSGGYFSNLHLSFLNVVKNICERIVPDRIDIVSPYMHGEAAILSELKAFGIGEINCLIPSLKTNEVLLSKAVFISMHQKGVKWSDWTESSVGRETRNLHAKLYRFYGAEETITVTGSVNFTGPAWRHCTADSTNDANVESAIVHIEKAEEGRLLVPVKDLNIESMKFLSRDDVNVTEMTGRAGRDAPYLNFTLNWKTNQLLSTGKITAKQRVRFKSLLLNQEIMNGRSTFELGPHDIKQLSKNALIELISVVDESLVYTYYPHQIEIESRPLNFRLNPDTILSFWLSGVDSYMEDELTGQIAAQVTSDSGEVEPENFISPSLLNDMARHFSGLISLEKKLYDQPNMDRTEQFRTLRYYLLTENLDTVQFYLKGLRDSLSQNKISKSFFWMIMQILRTRIYEQALEWPFKRMLPGEWPKFKSAIKQMIQVLTAESEGIAPSIEGLKEKAGWITAQIKLNYD